jgi:hypothetical protein
MAFAGSGRKRIHFEETMNDDWKKETEKLHQFLRELQSRGRSTVAVAVLVTSGMAFQILVILSGRASWITWMSLFATTACAAYCWLVGLSLLAQARSWRLSFQIRGLLFALHLALEAGAEFDSKLKVALETALRRLGKAIKLSTNHFPWTVWSVFSANRMAKKALKMGARAGFVNVLSEEMRIHRRFALQAILTWVGIALVAALVFVGLRATMTMMSHSLWFGLGCLAAMVYAVSVAAAGIFRNNARLIIWDTRRLASQRRKMAEHFNDWANRKRLLSTAAEFEAIATLYEAVLAIKWWHPLAIRALAVIYRAASESMPHVKNIVQITARIDLADEDKD